MNIFIRIVKQKYKSVILELDCGATLFTNSSGYIILPRNPTNYLATVNCTYAITANNLSYIWLNTYISTQFLQSFQDCGRESVTVGWANSFLKIIVKPKSRY